MTKGNRSRGDERASPPRVVFRENDPKLDVYSGSCNEKRYFVIKNSKG